MPLSPPALWSRGLSPGSPCESSGAADEQTHSQNTERILHKYERGDSVFALQSLTHVRLTCSIMCLTFLCWLFSMSSRWWIFSLRIATSFSNCSALKVQTESYNTLLHWADCHWLRKNNLSCALADLCSPFWPSSLILRSSRSSSSRLRIVSRRVALSCSIPPSNLWSSSRRLSFLSLASSEVFSFSRWSLRWSLSLLLSAWKRQGEKQGILYYFGLFQMWQPKCIICYDVKEALCMFVTCSLSFSSWCFFSASWSCAYKRLLTSLSLVLSASSSAS